MLTALSIRDIVLIERLDLSLEAGLTALTGETGAGKSILLDALGLALGERGDSGLVRRGATGASVTAAFRIDPTHPANKLLASHDMVVESELILRRALAADGRSRAFINDQPVSLALLREVAGLLVETHGQFEAGALLDRETHRATLDSFGRLEKPVAEIADAWAGWRAAQAALDAAREAQSRSAAEEAFLRESLASLESLDPQPDEAATLEATRTRLSQRSRILEALQGATTELTGARGAETALNNARRMLDRLDSQNNAALAEAREALARAAVELTEAAAAMRAMTDSTAHEEQSLETVDDRLFALRAAGRRHHCAVEDLANLRDDLRLRLAALDGGINGLAALANAEATKRADYETAALALTAARATAAKRLDKAIAAELPPLKLEKARVETAIEILPETAWGPAGRDRVTFLVATNPGAVPGPLAKIASGGELSRFMLAMKVVLAGVAGVPVMVFDEVDSGIGGATAAAVGERLQALGRKVQVLVVTHSPQVAARADHQWHVEKRTERGAVTTRIAPLDETGRREEIARMLSGAEITDEARAAASRLLGLLDVA